MSDQPGMPPPAEGDPSPYGAPPPPYGAPPPPPPYSAPPPSPYGATPPPYGAPPAPPYGPTPPPYGAPPAAYAYGYGPDQRSAEASSVRSQAIISLVVSGVGLLFCCGVTLPTVIISAIALSRVDQDLGSARKLVKWSWIAFGISIGLVVLTVVGFIALGVAGSSSHSSTYSTT